MRYSHVQRKVQRALMFGKTLARLLGAAKLLALILLVVYAPALVVIALAVVLTSPGPAFVSRCYRRPNGQLVDLWEFRTERWDLWQPTAVGQRLRQCSMYRLPALVNIVRGDICVGERVKSACDWSGRR